MNIQDHYPIKWVVNPKGVYTSSGTSCVDISQVKRGPCVVVIGNFDGLHKGHSSILLKGKERASALSMPLVVLTFSPHPYDYFNRQKESYSLQISSQKWEMMHQKGVDAVCVLTFNEALASMSAYDFMKSILKEGLQAHDVVVGKDFTFGKGREGSVTTLKESSFFNVYACPIVVSKGGGAENVNVAEGRISEGRISGGDISEGNISGERISSGDVPESYFSESYFSESHSLEDHISEVGSIGGKASGDAVISSSRIRSLIANGAVDQAALLLGYYFTVRGEVMHGAKLGRTINFPTINLVMGDYIRPAYGVYYGFVRILGEDSLYTSVMSLGVRPTIEGQKEELLEAYIFDFDREIYGQMVDVMLVGYIRGEEKFPSLDALKEKIKEDAEIAKKKLATCDKSFLQ